MLDLTRPALARRITAHVQRLATDIGPRPGGSPANRLAADYIAGVFHSCGLAVDRQEFAVPSWEAVETTLTVNGAPLPAVANTFSPACDVTAPAVAVGTLAELATANLRGRVAILYGDLAANTLSAKSWFLKSEHDDQVIRLLEEQAPAALLTIQPRLGELERLIEDWEFAISSATASAHTGLALLRAESPVVHLRIDSRRAAGSTWNLLGHRRGAGPGRVILCAHYDTKFDTPGALDNAAGVAVMLALAEALGGRALEHHLQCIAFGNEDTGLPTGSISYVEQNPQLGDTVALLNFDGVGHALDVNTVAIYAASPGFYSLVDTAKQAYPGLLWSEPWPESDHSAFSWRGVPCLAFTSRAGRYLAHLRCDTAQWVDAPRLAELAAFVSGIVEELQAYGPAWTRAEHG